MTPPAPGSLAADALESVVRDDRGRLLAALIARVGDFTLAEDALQEAMVAALAHWGRSGVPAAPVNWLVRVAERKAIDIVRARKPRARLAADLALLSAATVEHEEAEAIPDDRLRLIFTCCHPALEPKSQVALTLRTLCGLTTAEIARAFLDEEATMGQRLSRAKAKIAAARIPYAVPEPAEWPARLSAVLAVLYLVFNAGYSAGPVDGRDLAEEAIRLARLLDRLRPGDPEIEGFLALTLLTHARRAARTDRNGVTVPLSRQDRSLWDRVAIDEALALIERALGRGHAGPYQIKAAIAACHSDGPTSDWPQIAALYDTLLGHEPTAVVRLNRAVAIAEAGDVARGFTELERLAVDLAGYQPFHAARAELLSRLGRAADAKAAYGRAIALARSASDAGFLDARRAALDGE